MPPDPVEVRWEVADDEAMRHIVKQRPRDRDRRAGRIRSTSKSTASRPIAGTGIASMPATRRVRSAARARCPKRVTTWTACGSRSPPASTTRPATSPPTGTWRRKTSTSCSTSATTSTKGPAATTSRASTTGSRSMTLQDYRNRYAQYKLDPDLQAAHAAFPVDRHVGRSRGRQQLRRRHLREQRSARRLPARRAAAYQAYYEHMPLRRRPCRAGPAMQLYRQFAYGKLASFFVLDTRQYRTDQPCGDGTKAPCPGAGRSAGDDARRGAGAWLFDALSHSRRGSGTCCRSRS